MANTNLVSAPRVSVIVPTLNRPQLLVTALASLEQQNFTDWEAIVVDDGSRPEADFPTLRARFGPRVRGLHHATSRGGAAAKNTGVRESQGQILAFLDDDDLFDPHYLERAVAALDEHPEIEVLFMGVAWFGTNADWARDDCMASLQRTLDEARGSRIGPSLIAFDDRLVTALMSRVPMAFQQQVVRRTAFDAVGPFREGRVLVDSDWSLRAAIAMRTALLETGLYLQRVDGQSYVSRGDRLIDQLLANVDTKETLLAKVEGSGASARQVRIYREAVAKGWFDVAYGYAERGMAGKALAAWARSQQHAVNLSRLKFPLRIAAKWATKRTAQAPK